MILFTRTTSIVLGTPPSYINFNKLKTLKLKVYVGSNGEFELTIDDETKIMKAGNAFYFPPHVMHGAICRKAGKLIDVFISILEVFIE